MYASLSISNFRGVHRLAIDGLRRVNLLVGRNNTGKTTILEGFFLLGGATNPAFPTTLAQLRGQHLGMSYPDALWRPLFLNMDPHTAVAIHGQWAGEPRDRSLHVEALRVSSYADLAEPSMGEGGVAAVTQEFTLGGLRLRYVAADGNEETTEALFDPHTKRINAISKERADFVRTTFLSARSYPSLTRDAQQFSFLVRIKQERDVVDALRIIEPRVQRVEVLSEPGGPSVYVDVGLDSLIPVAACGEGFVRLFSIAVELTASRGGVLLIDEIDNGLHHSIMASLWTLLGTLADKHDVQVIATTHNEEMILSAVDAFKDRQGGLGLFRVDRRDGRHLVASYDHDAQQAVLEEHFEVRG
jgi:predicted ATPase